MLSEIKADSYVSYCSMCACDRGVGGGGEKFLDSGISAGIKQRCEAIWPCSNVNTDNSLINTNVHISNRKKDRQL